MRGDFGYRLVSVKTVMEYECNPEGEFGFIGTSGYTTCICCDNPVEVQIAEKVKED